MGRANFLSPPGPSPDKVIEQTVVGVSLQKVINANSDQFERLVDPTLELVCASILTN
jgi:hypothetical protein